MRGITQKDFAKFLRESFVSVWVDNESGFGTFPIESMVSGTPVIGKVPSLKPEWLSEENGIWTYHFNEIVDIIANYTQSWLEDGISEDLYSSMEKMTVEFKNEINFKNNLVNLFDDYFTKRKNLFSEQLEKIKVTEEK
jgi:glycosyltransferase involved in cell wall biosynthesis